MFKNEKRFLKSDFEKKTANCRKRVHACRKPTSFHMHDQNFIFKEIDIKEGDCFLDLGCGVGEYAIHALDFTGSSGFVYALDIQENLIEDLNEKARKENINNLKAITADIKKILPLKDNSIDICLISTVLHTLNIKKEGDKIFKEIFRILKPGGRLITIDCKKEDTGFGPPMHMRISPEELEEELLKYNFQKIKMIELGYFYMLQCNAKK